MSWFNRKTHREKYDRAEKNLEKRKKILEQTNYKKFYSSGLSEGDWNLIDFNIAKEKLNKLYAAGYDEAHELKRKYDELVAEYTSESKKAMGKYGERLHNKKETDIVFSKLKNINRKLYNFEKNELGMHKGENVKKNIGTMVGIISAASFLLAALLVTDITGNAIADVVARKILFFLL